VHSNDQVNSKFANVLLVISGALVIFSIVGELQFWIHQSFTQIGPHFAADYKVPWHIPWPTSEVRFVVLFVAMLASIAACALLMGKRGNWWRLGGTAAGWTFFGLTCHGLYNYRVVNAWWIVAMSAGFVAVLNVHRRLFPNFWASPGSRDVRT
jgi:hypothetical protein